jgi:tartrate dehydratase alpha subunit/fumarate hydratase class I-like protein
VSKVIVERLKECVADLISPYQTGFVLGRNIHENIVVAKEMAHTMHSMKGRKGAFAIKVDLTKAYDKLSWEFIWRMLREIDLPEKLINVIMHSVTSVMANVNAPGQGTLGLGGVFVKVIRSHLICLSFVWISCLISYYKRWRKGSGKGLKPEEMVQ